MRTETGESYQKRVERVLAHIQNHLDGLLSLEELAGVAHFSPYHFHRIFRGMVGESVKEHVRRLRLERAAHQLRFTRQPVTAIAFDAGYQTHESFTRAFRAAFRESPSGFRENHGAFLLGQAPSVVHFSPDGRPGEFVPAPGAGSPLEVRIERIGRLRLACARHLGPYEQVGPTWAKLMAWAASKGLLGPAVRALGIPHDDPEVIPPDALRYDAALVVDQRVRPEGEIEIQALGPGDYAVATHRGPYQRVGETYARLCGEWLPASGREELAAPAFEVYRNSPANTPPEDLLTDIHVPLAP